jgi:hypothetical protein
MTWTGGQAAHQTRFDLDQHPTLTARHLCGASAPPVIRDGVLTSSMGEWRSFISSALTVLAVAVIVSAMVLGTPALR